MSTKAPPITQNEIDDIIQEMDAFRAFWDEENLELFPVDGTTPDTSSVDLNSLLTICLHDWREYYGLVEAYSYCIKCDSKRAF